MVLTVDNLTRYFGSQVACEDVSFSVKHGEVVALLGENGAGKSTLLSVLAGFIVPGSGSVQLEGEILRFGEPARSLELGIGTAFQHFSLVPTLTVRDTFRLARLNVEKALNLVSEHICPETRISSLSVSERQQVEFAKARMLATRVLLLDEPTSLLGDQDVERVIQQVRAAAESGVACIFVTHRLREALAVADRVLVMRHGQVVTSFAKESDGWGANIEFKMLHDMFSDDPDEDVRDHHGMADFGDARKTCGPIQICGEINGTVTSLSLPGNAATGIVGVAGNGQSGLANLLTGDTATSIQLSTLESPGLMIHGAAMHNWFREHVSVVPEDRMHEGGAVVMSIGENLLFRDLVSGRMGRFGFVSLKAMRARAQSMIDHWFIQPGDPSAKLGVLSGGNIQRVLLARALDPLPSLLVAMGATQGLDHQSTVIVRRQLRRASAAGVAVVSIEYDLDDALRHSDYIRVIYRGQVSDQVPASEADREILQHMMVSGWGR